MPQDEPEDDHDGDPPPIGHERDEPPEPADAAASDDEQDDAEWDGGSDTRAIDARPRDAGPRIPPPPRPVSNTNVYSPTGEAPWLPAPNHESPPALVAGYGARRVISLDGNTWSHDVAVIDKGFDDWDNLRASAAGAGYLVAVGGGPRHDIEGDSHSFGRGHWRVLVSADGVDWVDMRGPGNWFGGIAYGRGRWVAAGGNGWWGHSKDLVHWIENPRHPTNNSAYRDLAFGNGLFIAVGGGNRVTSRDGLTWHHRAAGQSQAIAYGNGMFVAVGRDGCAVTSDGVTWREKACAVEMRDVAYGNGQFVASSREGILVSRDTVTWSAYPSQTITRIGFARGFFVGAVPGGIIKTSRDGRTWKVAYRRPLPNDWNTVASESSPF